MAPISRPGGRRRVTSSGVDILGEVAPGRVLSAARRRPALVGQLEEPLAAAALAAGDQTLVGEQLQGRVGPSRGSGRQSRRCARRSPGSSRSRAWSARPAKRQDRRPHVTGRPRRPPCPRPRRPDRAPNREPAAVVRPRAERRLRGERRCGGKPRRNARCGSSWLCSCRPKVGRMSITPSRLDRSIAMRHDISEAIGWQHECMA